MAYAYRVDMTTPYGDCIDGISGGDNLDELKREVEDASEEDLAGWHASQWTIVRVADGVEVGEFAMGAWEEV